MDDGSSLYAPRVRVYPRAVSGTWRRVKWGVLVLLLGMYYVVPWLRWNRGPGAPDQAILLDLDGRRGWIFDIVLWPQEVYFVTGFLILGAFGLFLATSLFGRVWCGFACPQTVWTDLFMLVERLIEGDRNERMRLDHAPLSAGKAAKKGLKHLVWLAIAAATGGAWVFYYVDAPSTLFKIFRGEASTEVYVFIGLLTATTYTLAGWAREQVCTYMCPWPRFQAAMLDEQSVIVTYQKWRGEQRGKHKAGDSWEGRGDCVDCRLCVNVCPTGIDIRDGQQLECIGCGLCIDACNETMAKVDLVHVPYKGAGAAFLDLISGQVQVTFSTVNSTMPYVNQGRLRALAVTTMSRSRAMPQLPTISEAALPGYEMPNWIGLVAPANTPKGYVVKLNAEVVKLVSNEQTVKHMAALGAEMEAGTPEAFGKIMLRGYESMGRVIATAGLKPE